MKKVMGFKAIFYPPCCAPPYTMHFMHYRDAVEHAHENDILQYHIVPNYSEKGGEDNGLHGHKLQD